MALRRLSLESAILGVLPATIVAVASASSWSTDLRGVAHPLRAVAVFALCALALTYAARRSGPIRHARAADLFAGGFLAVAAASLAWSVGPSQTLVRAGAFGLVVVAAAALGSAVAREPQVARRVLIAVVAGAAIVALVGLGIYAVSPDDAVQPATGQAGARFRGLGENPNTAAMLFAVALPLAALLVLEARSARARVGAAATLLLLAGSIAASGSRGALAAGCAGLLLFGLAAARRLVRQAVVVGAVAGFAGTAVLIGSVPKPLSPPEGPKAVTPAVSTQENASKDAEQFVRLEDEIGYPGVQKETSRRSFLSTSGRLDAWRGALQQAVRRPLLGYGFGTEQRVFVDRFNAFQGGVPENSFLGVFLQLGVLGLTLFLALLAALAGEAVRLLRTDRRLAAACIGVLGSAIALAFVQSYVYAAGNVATLPIWICAFMPVAHAAK